MFREETDLQIEIGALVRLLSHPVLRNEDEGRKEDRLDRGKHREHDKSRIKFRQGRTEEDLP